MHAFVFPGQGAQFVGMGKDLYDNVPLAKELFDRANEILGFPITDIMFAGTDEQLKQTKVTQPAIFLHSVILARSLGDAFKPDMAAGHSLGEFSALVAAGALGFEDGLKLVSKRAMAMQKACEQNPSTMAAIIALPDEKVEEICASVDGVVVPANYNCPGQLVISGTNEAIDEACAKLTAAGAKRALKLNVGGAFHSPLMEPARVELEAAIAAAPFADTAGRRSLADDDRNRIVILPDEIGDIELRAPHTRLTVSGRLAVYLDAERGGNILHTQQDGPVVPRITDLEPGRIADSFRHTVALPLLQRNHIGGCTARQRLFA